MRLKLHSPSQANLGCSERDHSFQVMADVENDQRREEDERLDTAPDVEDEVR